MQADAQIQMSGRRKMDRGFERPFQFTLNFTKVSELAAIFRGVRMSPTQRRVYIMRNAIRPEPAASQSTEDTADATDGEGNNAPIWIGIVSRDSRSGFIIIRRRKTRRDDGRARRAQQLLSCCCQHMPRTQLNARKIGTKRRRHRSNRRCVGLTRRHTCLVAGSVY